MGLLQKEVAERLNVSVSTVFNWERNRATPALWQNPKIIRFLGYSPYTTPQSFSGRLKAHRRATGLSQKKLAKTLRVDPSTLARWERGERHPRKHYLRRIEALLASLSPQR